MVSAPMMSFQCLTLESSFPYNLIENVVTTFCASLLAYKQTFLDPSGLWCIATYERLTIVIALFTIIRTDRNMLLACYSHKHISYRIRTIIRKAIGL
ncbi:hypothetical protein [Wolbachia endosymbiont (group A) of Scambus nigricans]|uniref:hypothetical protein n=1 Tax=Wolbachia endosymbiont (group A) of Scambus nigricans TaxID=2954055 RepID=UPI002230BE1F|nr:hypothetical protein [Wolbachia endosymbiont (group A) of Scambus nigricans]